MNSILNTFLSLILGIFAAMASAKAGVKVGCELTLTNDEIIRANKEDPSIRIKYAEALVKAIAVTCPECNVEPVKHEEAFDVTYPDGWWFRISLDHQVLEIQCKPFELSFGEEFVTRLERDLYTPAGSKTLNLKPKTHFGGGHLNLDFFTSFGGDLKLLKDFLVDLINHPAGMTIIGRDDRNAPHPILYRDGTWDRLSALFEDVEKGEVRDIDAFKSLLRKSVYRTSLFEGDENPWGARKFQFFNVHETSFGYVLELRFPEVQESPRNLIDLAALMEKRIAFLKEKNIPLHMVVPAENVGKPEKAVKEFMNYAGQCAFPMGPTHNLLRKAQRQGAQIPGYQTYVAAPFEKTLEVWGIAPTPRLAQSVCTALTL